MLPSVTAIIPAYGHRDYILRAVNSVLSQSFMDCEVIIVNDGSPDDSGKLLEPFVCQQLVRYISQPNQGQAVARNVGLGLARGRFIGFLDDDDLWHPQKLEWQVRHLEEHPDCVAVGGSVQSIDESGASLGGWSSGERQFEFQDVFGECPFITPGQTLIRATAIHQLGGLDTRYWGTDDYDLWFRLARIGKLDRIDLPALYSRAHSGNASGDFVRMARNVLRVASAHLPSIPLAGRKEAKRALLRWTYSRFARPALRRLATRLSHGDVRAVSALMDLLPYLTFRCEEELGYVLGRAFRRPVTIRCEGREI